jgi:hypothetical protein
VTLAGLLAQTLTVVTRGAATIDSEGDWVPGAATSDPRPGRLRLVRGDERNSGALHPDTDYIAYLDPAATVTADNQVTFDGGTYEITARPALLESPVTGLSYWKLELKRVG